MFCSNCGKTIPVGSATCVHCKMAVGSGEFSAASYIASLPEASAPTPEGEAKPRYTRFTRTTYTTMEDDGGDDVVRRTSYRPVLEEGESAPGGEGVSAREEAPAGEEERPGEERPEEEAPPEAPVGDPAALPESMLAQPLRPVKLPGISAATQERMRRLAEQTQEEGGAQRRPARPIVPSLFSGSARGEKTRAPKREIPPAEETPTEETPAEAAPVQETAPGEPAGAYYDDEDVFDTSDIEEEDYEPERRSLASFFRMRADRPELSRTARLGRTVLMAALVVAMLIGGFVWLSLRTAAKSPVAGVTSSLFERGVALIESHTTEQYRDRIVSTYTDDPTGAAALEMQLKDRAELSALLPGTPLANDQEFVDTLLAIQDEIDTAVTLDGLTALSGDGTELGGSSAERWSAIRNAVTRLKNASSATDFTAIAQGAAVSVTPTPEPSPTPSPYTTLTKGMKDSEEVRALQNRLYELGWFNDVRDGDFGALTQNSIKAFQQAVGLSVTGIADPETLAAIYADDAPRTGNRVTTPPADPAAGGEGGAQEQPAQTASPASPNS